MSILHVLVFGLTAIVVAVAGYFIWTVLEMPRRIARATRATQSRFRVVEVCGAFYVERHGMEFGDEWERLCLTHWDQHDRYVREYLWGINKPTDFPTFEAANEVMVQEAGREIARVPSVVSEI